MAQVDAQHAPFRHTGVTLVLPPIMLTRTLLILLSVCIALTPSCSLFRAGTQSVVVSATDSGAQLFADGAPIGTGTASVSLKRNESHTFLAKMPDGRAGTAQVGRSLSSTAMLDIVGGLFLILPFLGLLAPGAWDLDTTNVVIVVPTN